MFDRLMHGGIGVTADYASASSPMPDSFADVQGWGSGQRPGRWRGCSAVGAPRIASMSNANAFASVGRDYSCRISGGDSVLDPVPRAA
jgi:hypothetical protein